MRNRKNKGHGDLIGPMLDENASIKDIINAGKVLSMKLPRLKKKLEEKTKSIFELEKELVLLRYGKYQKHWKTTQKIVYALVVGLKPLMTKEIGDLVLEQEPELKNKWKNPSSTIKKAIYTAMKYGLLQKYDMESKRIRYGLTPLHFKLPWF